MANAKVTISSQAFTSSALTQADGKFEFQNLPPARYRITTEAENFRKAAITVNITRPDETIPPQTIRLSASSLRVTVFDTNNQPLGGVALTLYTQERGVTGAIAARATTDEGGDAYFGRLAAGSYLLLSVLRGYEKDNRVVLITTIRNTVSFPLQVAPVIPINEKAVLRHSVPNLPSKNIQAIFQDSEGWMWFGTDKGVARFNGSDFLSSATAGSGYEWLAGEDARSIAEDAGDVIWLATPRGARRVAKDGTDAGTVLDGQDARQVFVDSRDKVWVATGEGLFRFDGKSFTLFDQPRGLPSNDVKAVAEDKGGMIWIATAAGVAIVDDDKIAPLPGANQITDAQALFVDKAGQVWIATSKGVLLFDGNRLASVAINGGRESAGAPALKVRAISQDRSGRDPGNRLWFALETGGVLLYDPARNESQKINSLERDRVAAILNCREGILWFGTDNGAVQSDYYSFVNFSTSRGLSDDDVRAVAEAPGEGQLWFVTAAGVSRLEGERFVSVERFRASISVNAVAFDRAGTAWFATGEGVIRLSGQALTQFSEGNGLASKNVHWVASIAGGSAMIFATARGAAIYRDGNLSNLDALSGFDVRHVFEDSQGRLWFSTARGVVRLNLATGETDFFDTARGLADNDTRWITQFKNKLLVATRARIQEYNERDRNSSGFSTFNAEPANTLYVDRDNYLWAGSDGGQIRKFALLGDTQVSALYSSETYGLTATRINSFSEDSSGRIWIATDKGAVRHIPVKTALPTRVSLKVDGRPQTGNGAETFSVPYGRHSLTFRFGTVSFGGPVWYLYRINLEHSSEPWKLLPFQPGAEREVSRLDLDEGRHTFELIALNRDLYGGGDQAGAGAPAATLSLRVGSPFWKRWWFYTLVLALIGLAAATAVAAQRLRAREYVLPKELRTYLPIEPNPYIVGNPIRAENMFYGREDDFRYVRTKLEGVNQGVVIVFCGERRVGKSSILYQVLNGRLGDRFIPVFVDMQEMVIASDAEFFARISRLITEAVNRSMSASAHGLAGASDQGENVKVLSGAAASGLSSQTTGARAGATASVRQAVSVPVFDGRNPYPVFIDFLDEVLHVIGDRTLLILMDEYELMEGKVDEGKLSPEMFTFLAGLMDNKERLALMFTGSRRLEERDKKYWRELLRRSLFRKVAFLSENDARRLITEPVAGRVVYGRGVVDVIYRLTAGQPFYTQVICQNTVDYLNEHKQNWVTLTDLKAVIADVVDNPLPQMIYTWDVLSDDEKIVLSLLAETLPDGNDYARSRELHQSVKANDYPVNLSENTIRLTLEEMFRRELIEKDSGDGFRFKIDLFRLWIRRSHSIWQVVKEVRTL